MNRKPIVISGSAADPYMLRWILLPKNEWFNIYVHKILRDDDSRALHDHPYWNLSLILKGRYREITPKQSVIYGPLDLKLRSAKAAHRLEVVEGPVWTLFFVGPRIREWGFHCPQGWRHWTKYVDMTDSGKIGPGCGEP